MVEKVVLTAEELAEKAERKYFLKIEKRKKRAKKKIDQLVAKIAKVSRYTVKVEKLATYKARTGTRGPAVTPVTSMKESSFI